MKPADLVILRNEMLRWSGSPGGLRVSRGLGLTATALRDTFALADLFYVSQDMTTLACAAGESLPEFAVNVGDLPSDHGFLIYEAGAGEFIEQRLTLTGEGELVQRERVATRRAAAWTTSGGAVWWSLFEDRTETMHPSHPGESIPSLVVYGVGRILFGAGREFKELSIGPDGDASEATDRTFNTQDHARTFLAACLLMTQPGVSSSRLHDLSKVEKAKLKRRRIPPSPVRVVTLRRLATDSPATGHQGRDYAHRWLVRGHWRQQPCGPGRVERRPTWITPHIKGPEGAPLMAGEKVYAWVR